MKKTWNSWTYYGDRDSGRRKTGDRPQDSVCQESWKESWDQEFWNHDHRETDRQPPRGERFTGVVEDAYEQAFRQSAADALERAMDLHDVRHERVVRVRSAIQEGTYWVPAGDLARKLVRNMLGDY